MKSKHIRLTVVLIGIMLVLTLAFASCVSRGSGTGSSDLPGTTDTPTEDRSSVQPETEDPIETPAATIEDQTTEGITTQDVTTEETTKEDTTASVTTESVTTEPETTVAVTTAPVTVSPETDPPKPLDTLIYNADDTPVSNPPESVRLSFIGMGDNLIHSSVINQSYNSATGTYDFRPKYAAVADIIKNADISFINQEAPICGPGYGALGYPRFNTPVEMGYNLAEIGFDVFCFANNHVADQGMKGIGNMFGYLEKFDALSIGIYKNTDDYDTVRIYETQGVRIAFLAYTYGTNQYGKKTQYSTYPYCIPVYNTEVVTRQVSAAREYADIVIVSMHWGSENKFSVNHEQQTYAKLLADLGVDVILGTHPHVVQAIEKIQGKNGNETICYYSLGNGINSQTPLNNVVGIMASFDIVKDKNGARIENVKCIPTISQQEKGYSNVRLIPVSEFTDALAAAHNCNYTDRKVTVQAVHNILTAHIAAEYLPLYITDPEAALTETTTPPTTEPESTAPEQPKLTVCIDPGHQIKGISETEPNGPGSTVMKKKLSSGTQGVYTRIPEYQLNLDVSLMLKEELIKRGYNVIMIRETNDCPLSNAERAIVANESGADIFVRIHANGSSNGNVSGALCCAPTVNNEFLTEENIAASRELSKIIVDNLCRETGAVNRGLYSVDTMTGINWCKIPVTIVEMGYMSNKEEDILMSTDEYRLKIVDGIADGIDAYFAPAEETTAVTE